MNKYLYILAWFKTYGFIYGASPAAGCAARAREQGARVNSRVHLARAPRALRARTLRTSRAHLARVARARRSRTTLAHE